MPLIQEQFFDIGANLTHQSFAKDLDSVLSKANKLGVKRLSVTGSSVKDSLEAFEITQRYPKTCISSAGIHPHNAKEFSSASFSEIEELESGNLKIVFKIEYEEEEFYEKYNFVKDAIRANYYPGEYPDDAVLMSLDI
mgnify:CR=1 FL=1